MTEILVAPSILSADFANLERDVKMIENAGADWIHVDVMDGQFVPNITVGVPVVKSLKKIAQKPLDVHLMINNPERFIVAFADAGADILTIHYEAVQDHKTLLQMIKGNGMKAGISIKPNTPPEVLDGLYDYLDLILVMTVEPGFGGQDFMEECAEKIAYYKSLNLPNTYLEVDGGINAETAKIVKKYGANVLVAGNYVFSASDAKSAIEMLKIS